MKPRYFVEVGEFVMEEEGPGAEPDFSEAEESFSLPRGETSVGRDDDADFLYAKANRLVESVEGGLRLQRPFYNVDAGKIVLPGPRTISREHGVLHLIPAVNLFTGHGMAVLFCGLLEQRMMGIGLVLVVMSRFQRTENHISC